MSIRPILVDRATAAEMLGISPQLVKEAQDSGKLPAKTTHINPVTGKATGKALYRIADLEAWAEGLADA